MSTTDPPRETGALPLDPDGTSAAIGWAAACGPTDAMASVNWLAADASPAHGTAEALLSDPNVPLNALLSAKNAYKTLRVVGETAEDRSQGARWYAATIAAGLVHHRTRISAKSDQALDRALADLVDDTDMPPTIRELAVRALFRLRSGTLLDRDD